MSRALASFQLPLLRAEHFRATKYHSAEDKVAFGNGLLAFVAEDFPRERFTLRFYRVLCQHFGMIAHFDAHGFWAEYFTSTADKLRFLEEVTAHGCWGDPAYTLSDLERAVVARLRAARLVARLRAARARETEAAQRAVLNPLQARYQPEGAPSRSCPARMPRTGPPTSRRCSDRAGVSARPIASRDWTAPRPGACGRRCSSAPTPSRSDARTASSSASGLASTTGRCGARRARRRPFPRPNPSRRGPRRPTRSCGRCTRSAR